MSVVCCVCACTVWGGGGEGRSVYVCVCMDEEDFYIMMLVHNAFLSYIMCKYFLSFLSFLAYACVSNCFYW